MPWFEQQLIADGVTATGRVVVPKALLEAIINDHIATVAVNSGGTGYVVGIFGNDYAVIGRVTSFIFLLGVVAICFTPDTSNRDMTE